MNGWRRVNLPRLSRPNLVARLYMLFVAQGTIEIAWLIPSSATARIIVAGGLLAQIVLLAMTVAVVFGLLDVLANDVARLGEKRPGWVSGCARWLQSRRIDRCYVIGGAYILQAYAGMEGQVEGTVFLLLYYLKLAGLAALLAWSLLYLEAADAGKKSVPG